MGEHVASVCDRCGLTVVKKQHSDDDGMVHFSSTVESGSLLLFVDVPKGKSHRPVFNLVGKLYCPTCLLAALDEWLEEVA